MLLDPRTHAAIEITKALITARPEILGMDGHQRDVLIEDALSLLSEVSDTMEHKFHDSFFTPEAD